MYFWLLKNISLIYKHIRTTVLIISLVLSTVYAVFVFKTNNNTEKITTLKTKLLASATKPNKTLDTFLFLKNTNNYFQSNYTNNINSYTFSENPLTWLLGKFVWDYFNAKVLPEHILSTKLNDGICSQKTIAFLFLIKDLQLNHRLVILGKPEGPGHFLCGVNYNNSWHLFDPTIKVKDENKHFEHRSIDALIKNRDTLHLLYDTIKYKEIFKTINFSKVNEQPAKKMVIVHTISFAIIYCLPILFLFLVIKYLYIHLAPRLLDIKVSQNKNTRHKKRKFRNTEPNQRPEISNS